MHIFKLWKEKKNHKRQRANLRIPQFIEGRGRMRAKAQKQSSWVQFQRRKMTIFRSLRSGNFKIQSSNYCNDGMKLLGGRYVWPGVAVSRAWKLRSEKGVVEDATQNRMRRCHLFLCCTRSLLHLLGVWITLFPSFLFWSIFHISHHFLMWRGWAPWYWFST